MSQIFVTGVTGLVGRAVAAELGRRPGSAKALVRGAAPKAFAHLECVIGDLTDPSSFADQLEGVESVLHIAALTGAARPEDFQRVNVDGTRALLAACAEAGVARFTFVSSVAAGFADLDDYPYGASKRDAEAAVRASGLAWAIVRPTVVVGPGSPILERFAQLASLPISPLPGRGQARIQPVAVWDVASCLLDLVDSTSVSGETIELGGPEVVTLEEFLSRVRVASGKKAGPIVRLPLAPIRLALSGAVALTAGRFPVSPAQLAMFEQDGVAQPHPFLALRLGDFADIEAMLEGSLAR